VDRRTRERAIALFELCLNAPRIPTRRACTTPSLSRATPPKPTRHGPPFAHGTAHTVLAEVVSDFVENYLMREDPRLQEVSATFTRALCLFSLMTVQIIFSHHVQRPDRSFEPARGMDDVYLSNSTRIRALLRPRRASGPYTFVATENLESVLASATFQVVGRSGYSKATIARIARRASCSPDRSTACTNPKKNL